MRVNSSARQGSNATFTRSFCSEYEIELEELAPIVVNAKDNPDLVQQILEDALLAPTRPRREATLTVERPCLFLDPDHKACVFLTDKDTYQIVKNSWPWCFVGSNLLNEQFNIQRATFTANALRELVLTFTNGLDDRIIELLKYDLRTELMVNGLTLKKGLVQSIRLDSVDGDYLTFAVTYDNERATAKKSIRAYEEVRRALLASSLADVQPLRADSLWAAVTHSTLENEGLI